LWHCFGDCQRGGDVIELVKELTSYDNAHVRFWFHEHFGERLSGKKSRAPIEQQPAIEKDTAHVTPQGEISQAAPNAKSNLSDACEALKPLRFRLNLDPDVPYLRQRGLTPEVIARFGLGLCRRGVLKGYVAIPIYRYPAEPGENPVAYLGRWPGEDFDESAGRPRYKWPEGFPKSQVVYGLAEALDGTEGKPLLVVEGPFTVYLLAQASFTNSVAILGAALSDEQAHLLASANRPVHLFLDNDEAGRTGSQLAVGRLVAKTFVRVSFLPIDINIANLTRHQIQSLID
jgi:DNA primase